MLLVVYYKLFALRSLPLFLRHASCGFN